MSPRHFIPMPCGRAGPVGNAVSKSTTWNAGSTVSVSRSHRAEARGLLVSPSERDDGR